MGKVESFVVEYAYVTGFEVVKETRLLEVEDITVYRAGLRINYVREREDKSPIDKGSRFVSFIDWREQPITDAEIMTFLPGLVQQVIAEVKLDVAGYVVN